MVFLWFSYGSTLEFPNGVVNAHPGSVNIYEVDIFIGNLLRKIAMENAMGWCDRFKPKMDPTFRIK